MCGIVGAFDRTQQSNIDPSILHVMNDSLSHRGPDETGFFFEKGIALAHKRLRIIDLKNGQQPMHNRHHSLTLVYNGEIYNYIALRQELERLGYKLHSTSDTEVLLYGFEAWGIDVLSRINGMFAFAIWDHNTRTLYLARDRFGKKPLYYTLLNTGEFIFGSELKALTRHPGFKKNLNQQGIADYFAFGYIPDPKTCYQDVFKLMPGHYLKVRQNTEKLVPSEYWDLTPKPLHEKTSQELIENLKIKVSQSVSQRLISDVPLGAFLSGGVDSSIIVAAMAALTRVPTNTFSIAFDEASYDESSYSHQVADIFQTKHHCEKLSLGSANLFTWLVNIYDEPFADSSSIPTLKVCETARKKVVVVLSGDGSDEIFAGYRRYRGHLVEESVRNAFPSWLRRNVLGFISNIYPDFKSTPRFFRGKALLKALQYNTIEGYFNNIALVKPYQFKSLFTKKFYTDLQTYLPLTVLNNHIDKTSDLDPLQIIQYLDVKTYLPGDILTKIDRASMYYSLEVRSPFLDYELVEWAFSLPLALKIKMNIGKYILKEAFKDKVPPHILYRKKQGFAVPLRKWFQSILKSHLEALKNNSILFESNIIEMKTVKKMIEDHLNNKKDHSALLWALCIFENFLLQTQLSKMEQEAYAHTACA